MRSKQFLTGRELSVPACLSFFGSGLHDVGTGICQSRQSQNILFKRSQVNLGIAIVRARDLTGNGIGDFSDLGPKPGSFDGGRRLGGQRDCYYFPGIRNTWKFSDSVESESAGGLGAGDSLYGPDWKLRSDALKLMNGCSQLGLIEL